jgi:hypothetical protein
MKNELNAGIEVDSNSTAELLPSASLAQNPMLAEVLLFLEKEYKDAISRQGHEMPNIKYFQGREDVCKEVKDFIKSHFT